jgi:phosphopantothenoylcysteine decarboxylase/phosphopantothenate--cysteine ligase
VVVAPATARLIGSYAAGISSDLLTATLLATTAPVLLCPAMHAEMWSHSAVVDNVALLRKRGVHVLEPAEGRLAGGDFGKGRLPAPDEIVAALSDLLGPLTLRGLKAVVSAGGTREPVDPVRFIGNRSSGKQGFAIAAELAHRGADVTIVSATEIALATPAGARVVQVETAAEMASAVLVAAAAADIVVMAAAVADYRPATAAEQKLKKTGSPISLELVPTLDILAELGTRRRAGQVLVGFAAETAGGDELVGLGRAKLMSKRADVIVANDVSVDGAGFGEDRNSAVIVAPESTWDLGVADKRVVAVKLVDVIEGLICAKEGAE